MWSPSCPWKWGQRCFSHLVLALKAPGPSAPASCGLDAAMLMRERKAFWFAGWWPWVGGSTATSQEEPRSLFLWDCCAHPAGLGSDQDVSEKRISVSWPPPRLVCPASLAGLLTTRLGQTLLARSSATMLRQLSGEAWEHSLETDVGPEWPISHLASHFYFERRA